MTTDEQTGLQSLQYSYALMLLALGLGGFAIGTGEFVIMGLLPEAAAQLDISIPAAGSLISAYAIGAMVGAPLFAALAAGWRRRGLLIWLMLLYAVANLTTVVVPGYLGISLTRFASGLPHAPFFGIASLVAAGLAPPGQRGRAVGFVMLGLCVAILFGAPLAAWIGQEHGWRFAFACVGGLAAMAAVLIRCWVPDVPVTEGASPLRELKAIMRPQVWTTLAIAGIGFGGMFCVFSYIKPTLVEVSGLEASMVPFAMALFGAGSIAGTLIGAHFADRALLRTIGAVLLYSAVLLACFGLLVQSLAGALTGVFLLGGVGALGPALQIRLMDIAGDAQTLAASLHHSAFNFANATGAWIGGMAIGAGLGWADLGPIGALLSIGGLLALAFSLTLHRQAVPAD